MPYTQSVLESELSKQHGEAAPLPWRLFILSTIVFGTVLSLYLGMRFGFEQLYLQGQIDDAKNKYENTIKTVSEQDRATVINYYSQLANIDTLTKAQRKETPFLDMLERDTLKAVSYTNLTTSLDDRAWEMKIEGKAPSYAAVAQQLDLFKKDPLVKNATLSGARFNNPTEGIVFAIQLTLNRK